MPRSLTSAQTQWEGAENIGPMLLLTTCSTYLPEAHVARTGKQDCTWLTLGCILPVRARNVSHFGILRTVADGPKETPEPTNLAAYAFLIRSRTDWARGKPAEGPW